MKYSTYYYMVYSFVTAMGLSALVACTGDDIGADAIEAQGDFCIRAAVSGGISVRGLKEGEITTSTKDGYRFSYPAQPDKYITLPCTFEKGTGLVAAPSDGHFLTWADVATAKHYTFCLDNVPHDNNGTGELYGVEFSEEEKKRYAAGIDNEDATNDIVWGKYKVDSRTSVDLNFDLYHCMTRLSVQVTSDSDTELKEATVKLTNVVLLPENFNRLTGEVGIAANPVYKDITLREGEGWEPETVAEGEIAPPTYIYKTAPFIFPPQRLQEGKDRPHLKISMLENGTLVTYSAPLPTALTITTGGVTSSMQLSRLSAGQHLTLNVTLLHDNEKPLLEFRPAAVERWEDKGQHSVVANKAGIYDVDGLKKLIAAYNRLKQAIDENNETESKTCRREVARYGTEDKETSQWTFNLFANIEFSPEEKFRDSDFTFEMYGHTITIGDKEYDENNVKELVEALSQQP